MKIREALTEMDMGRGAEMDMGRGAVMDMGRGAEMDMGRGAEMDMGRGAEMGMGRGAEMGMGRGAVGACLYHKRQNSWCMFVSQEAQQVETINVEGKCSL